MEALSTFDWALVAAYLLLVGLLGFYVSGKQGSTQDYFLGGRSLPWWAATLSILATETSAVTYIGIPRGAYEGDWSVLQLVTGFVLGRIFLASVFVKVFYRRDYLTVYGFLAVRFGEKTRRTAAVIFFLGRVLASGVRLFAGCLALHVVCREVPLVWIIVGLGAFGTVLTYTGGIRAVVWTDVVLGLTLIAGGLACVYFLLDAIPGGVAAVARHAELPTKLSPIHWSIDLGDAHSLLAGLAGGFVLTLATHGTDQDIAQRMLTCRDSRSGSFSVLGSAVLIVPLFCLFLSIGTLLYFYHSLGQPPYDVPDDLNQLLPTFIVNVLPSGVAGLAVAGLVAAALSSLTSALNALASTAIGDFYRPLSPGRDERHFLRASKVTTGLCGLLLVLVAVTFIGSEQNIFELALKVFTYFYGALLGPFLLGILTRRGTDGSAFLGMLLSVPVVGILQVREFIAEPRLAPAMLQNALEALPSNVVEAVLRTVPNVAWPYWIIIGTLVSMVPGLLRRPVIVRQ